jgi:16S rRNA (guanine1516-N2)-methyltransferase
MPELLSKQEFHYHPTEWLEVIAEDASMDSVARRLAIRLQSSSLPEGGDESCRYMLNVGYDGLSLRDKTRPHTKPFWLDVTAVNHHFSGRDLLARAIGRRCRTVVDATAGFGRDAFRLFRLGKRVTAIERSPVVATILADGMNRLISPSRIDSLTLICDDARRWLAQCDRPDVVYLDPMFPNRHYRSALAAKELRILRSLVGDDADAVDLFAVAQSVASQRVVVKRPSRSEPLVTLPDLEYKGKVVRYDVYLTAL